MCVCEIEYNIMPLISGSFSFNFLIRAMKVFTQSFYVSSSNAAIIKKANQTKKLAKMFLAFGHGKNSNFDYSSV